MRFGSNQGKPTLKKGDRSQRPGQAAVSSNKRCICHRLLLCIERVCHNDVSDFFRTSFRELSRHYLQLSGFTQIHRTFFETLGRYVLGLCNCTVLKAVKRGLSIYSAVLFLNLRAFLRFPVLVGLDFWVFWNSLRTHLTRGFDLELSARPSD
jgi:hypothetical protein